MSYDRRGGEKGAGGMILVLENGKNSVSFRFSSRFGAAPITEKDNCRT